MMDDVADDTSIWAKCKRKPQWIPFTSKDEASLQKFVLATGGGLGEMGSPFDVAINKNDNSTSDPIEKRVFNQQAKSSAILSDFESVNSFKNSEGTTTYQRAAETKDQKQNEILGFGRIAFPESNAHSLYLRVPWKLKGASGSEILSTHPQALLFFIENVWKLPRPRLLISITGGAVDFPMDPHKEAVLEQLMDTARRTNAWLVTGGSRAGIMKYVGKLIRASVCELIRSSVSCLCCLHAASTDMNG